MRRSIDILLYQNQSQMQLTQTHKKSVFEGFYEFFNRITILFGEIRKEVFYIYGLFFMISLMLVSLYNKQTLHLMLNDLNTPFFDAFFKYSTFLGDGIMFGVLFLWFAFINKRVMWAQLVSAILTLVTTHFLKKIIFRGIARPAGDFGIENLHIVEGVKMAFWNSFPSGHTITAFTIGTILCLYFRKCKSQYIWASLAIIAGLSRVYLSQHYWIDIFVGSFVGIILGFISMALFYRVRSIH